MFNITIHLKYNARHIGNDESFLRGKCVLFLGKHACQECLPSMLTRIHQDKLQRRNERKEEIASVFSSMRRGITELSIVSSLLPRDRLFPADFILFFTFSHFFSLLFSWFRNRLDCHLLLQSLRDRSIHNSHSTVTCRPSLTTSR